MKAALYQDASRAWGLLEADALMVLAKLPEHSVDAIVTDPPYGIGFHDESWDSTDIYRAADRSAEPLSDGERFAHWTRSWANECRRVLKPGGHMLAFGAPRTFHRLTAGIEDAGIEIRDVLMWVYAQGAPKAHKLPGGRAALLKPAYEPILLARKALAGTTPQNLEAWGTGALNTEGARVHSKEGYSIEGQREACEAHAERLGARVIAEFVEPGKTGTNTKRPALQQMLTELAGLRPTYAIFYDLSRVAREEMDALWLLSEIKSHGTKLESTLEHISDDDTGMLIYTIMAGVNAHRSRRDATKVKMGLERKFLDGGTSGQARIGYLNVRDTAGGKEVRSIATDPERKELVQLAFDAFATGEYSITTLRDMLEEVGLRTRPTPKRGPKALSRNGVYRMLRDDYYIGLVTRGGVKRDGRHEAIIDREVFEKVQRTLEAHRLSGDRSKKHKHYLKGSIFCGCCGERLIYGRHRGNGGVYEYFSCLTYHSRRPRCGVGDLPVDSVERAIERYYRSVEMTPAMCEAVRRELKGMVGARLEVAEKKSKQHKRKLRDLQSEQQKLLQLFYKGSVDEDVLQAEQQRIQAERTQAERWATSASHEAEDALEALDEALALIQGCHAIYMAADAEERRLMNQAIFAQLLIQTDTIEGEQQPVYAHMLSLATSQPSKTLARTKGPRNDQDPHFSGGLGSNVDQLVRANGSKSNQDSGSIDEALSKLLAALAAQEVQSGLSRLAKKLVALRASDGQPRAITSRRLRPRRPGWVLYAVRAAMAEQAGPMRVAHVHAAVEASLGETVSANSVSWVLASHSAGPSPLFVRVARGRYVLATTA